MAIDGYKFQVRWFVGGVSPATLVLLVCMFGAGVASATSVNCTGALSGTFDNIIVPAGAECDLGVATVNGSISVGVGASLYMTGPATVKGSVSGIGSSVISITNSKPLPTLGTKPNALVNGNSILGNLNIGNNDSAYVCGAFIGGNVFITGTHGTEVAFGGSDRGAFCSTGGGGNVIGGTVSIQNNNASFFGNADNVVGHSMTVSGNQGAATKNVLNNSVTGTLACFNNAQPFQASGNTAAKATGQCSGGQGGGGG